MPKYLATRASALDSNNDRQNTLVAFLAPGAGEVRADGRAAGAGGEKWGKKNDTGGFSRPGRGDYKLYSARPELPIVSSHHDRGD